MFVVLNFILAWGSITYDSGYYRQFDYLVQSFSCLNGAKYAGQVNFNQPFANPPQIILVHGISDQSTLSTNQKQDVLFNISSITTTYFELTLLCNANQVYAFRLRWYAIDDNRIEVINQFNAANFQSQTFIITISSITPTNFSIQFSDPKSLIENLLSIQYQIILAPPEQLTFLNTIWTNAAQTSPNINVVPNTFFMFPKSGQEYANNDIWRQNTTIQSADPIKYSLDVWDGGKYSQSIHQQILLLYSFNKPFRSPLNN